MKMNARQKVVSNHFMCFDNLISIQLNSMNGNGLSIINNQNVIIYYDVTHNLARLHRSIGTLYSYPQHYVYSGEHFSGVNYLETVLLLEQLFCSSEFNE